MVYSSVILGGILQVTPAVSLFRWNRDFYNFQGKWKFVRKISENMFENQRWHGITPVLTWFCFKRTKKAADNNGLIFKLNFHVV